MSTPHKRSIEQIKMHNDSTMAAKLWTSTGQVMANVTDNEQIKQTWNA